MPDEPGEKPRGGLFKSLEPKDQKRREQVLVGVGVVGVLLTFMILRRSASNAAQPAAGNGIDPNTGLPYSTELAQLSAGQAGTGQSSGSFSSGVDASTLAMLQSQVNGLSAQLINFQATPGPQGPPGPPGPPAPVSSSPTAISQTPNPAALMSTPTTQAVGAALGNANIDYTLSQTSLPGMPQATGTVFSYINPKTGQPSTTTVW